MTREQALTHLTDLLDFYANAHECNDVHDPQDTCSHMKEYEEMEKFFGNF